MIVIYEPGIMQQGQRSGHYYACEKCGWCAPIRTGPDSRLTAVLDGVKHEHAKQQAHKQLKLW